MYFDAIAKIVSERTGCDVSTIKPESKFSDLGIDSQLLLRRKDSSHCLLDTPAKSHLLRMTQRVCEHSNYLPDKS